MLNCVTITFIEIHFNLDAYKRPGLIPNLCLYVGVLTIASEYKHVFVCTQKHSHDFWMRRRDFQLSHCRDSLYGMVDIFCMSNAAQCGKCLLHAGKCADRSLKTAALSGPICLSAECVCDVHIVEFCWFHFAGQLQPSSEQKMEPLPRISLPGRRWIFVWVLLS